MDNVKFEFIFGKPPEGHFGRWVEGSVAVSTSGTLFVAKLRYAVRGPGYGCHPVELDVPGAFQPAAFASFLNAVSTGRFATATRELVLLESEGLGTKTSDEILSSIADQGEDGVHSGLTPEKMTSVAARLERVRHMEILGRFA
jgi:hypothetical protein